eukprot:GEMP01038021.1.p1 GENE.GEMP01038021.1~~GEMP01038021.1.p1  ORF type:complete len:289 (+),score=56.12 GEMP01038021.1:157-1023(+)
MYPKKRQQAPPMAGAVVQGVPQQAQANVMMQPVAQQQMMPPAQAGVVWDGFAVLNACPFIRIKQKMEWLEAITGFETKNEYVILDSQGLQIMKAKEDSDCCSRQCLPGNCRPYNYDIQLNVGAGGNFLHIERPFQCTCCCFNRPELNVYDNNNTILGYISDPWACCDMTFDIFDASRNKVLTVYGACCQIGLFCPCPFGSCARVEFAIKDARTNADVGSITKTFRTANFFAASDADNYEINFEHVTHPQWKAMVVALAIFLDMNYFEKGGQQQRDDSALGQLGHLANA